MARWLLFAVLLLPSLVFAAWEDFEGISSWKVQATEDQRGCGGGSKTATHVFTIVHKKKTAQVADPVHGSVSGIFEGDVLYIPSRTIPDGAGSSKLSGFDAVFTCTTLHAKYRWDYRDKQMSCSGTTEWKGTQLGGKGCPGAPPPQQKDMITQIAERRSEEGKYEAILAKDPKNFWANWDMAELKKKQGNYKDYFTYLNKATSNDEVFAKTRTQLKDEAVRQLGLSEYPTPTSVPILRAAQDDLAGGGVVYNVNFPQPGEENKQKWYTMLWAAYVPDSSKILKDLAGIKEEP
ncbi:hypothetical protein HY490_03185 [Candidatus Woesearchaeota archaeon]|nr:hypothetical protein [Candidatus Woesearchaeota archaeon]